VSEERREKERLQVYKVVGIDCGDHIDRVGITRNVSPRGALFHSASEFVVGDFLVLLMQSADSDVEDKVAARVVRVELEDPAADSPFPHLTAVEFDEPIELPEE